MVIIMKKIIITLSLFVPAIFAFGATQCQDLTNEIEQYSTDLFEYRQKEPDREFYLDQLKTYREFIERIQSQNCPQRDSLIMEIQWRFAVRISRQQGDLELFKGLMENSVKLMQHHVDSLEVALKEAGKSLDELRDMQKRINDIKSQLQTLKTDYADLTVIMPEHFDKMTKVVRTVRGNDYQVQIHFRAPADVYNDDLKRRRLEYLSETFDMVLDSYDPTIGFYFKIPMVPLSSRTAGEQTYAITFDEKVRFRIQNFSYQKRDTLYIKPLPNWKFVNNITGDYAKVQIPPNLNLQVYDKQNARWIYDLKESTEFIYIEADSGDALYLPVQDEQLTSYELVFQERKETSKWITYTTRALGVVLFAGLLGVAL